MTTFKTVVSWLGFLFLAYRGSLLAWPWALALFEVTPPLSWGPWEYESGVNYRELNRIWVWSPVWCLIAVALIFPWLRAFAGRMRRSSCLQQMDDPVPLTVNLVGRWGFALLFLLPLLGWLPDPVTGFLTFDPAADFWDQWNPFHGLFEPFMLGILAAMMLAPEGAALASSGFTRFIDAVFFPGGREAKPPYSLKLARFYAEKERWDEAEAEYARMLEFYPDMREAWQERLELAFRRPATAGTVPAEVLAAAFKALSKPDDREALHRRFTELTP
jgi:hypothetical protein